VDDDDDGDNDGHTGTALKVGFSTSAVFAYSSPLGVGMLVQDDTGAPAVRLFLGFRKRKKIDDGNDGLPYPSSYPYKEPKYNKSPKRP